MARAEDINNAISHIRSLLPDVGKVTRFVRGLPQEVRDSQELDDYLEEHMSGAMKVFGDSTGSRVFWTLIVECLFAKRNTGKGIRDLHASLDGLKLNYEVRQVIYREMDTWVDSVRMENGEINPEHIEQLIDRINWFYEKSVSKRQK